MTDFTIIEAPSNLGLKPDSVEHPRWRAAGCRPGAATSPSAMRAGGYRPTMRGATPIPDPERGRIRDFSIMLADIVGPVVGRGSFPVVLGGDCSILLGNPLALAGAASGTACCS